MIDIPASAARASSGPYDEALRRTGLPGRSEGRLLFDEPMARWTTFRVGGIADAVLCPRDSDELVQALRQCRSDGIPVTILGNGSNVVVSDAGIRGLVIVFGQPFSTIAIRQAEEGWYEVHAEAGASLAGVAGRCASAGLTGMEFACGIPGTIGGAVFMNAGAYDGCMADTVRETSILDADLRIREIDLAGHRFGYRESALMEDGLIILGTRLLLRSGDRSRIEARVSELAARRRQTQPLELPSAGSAFKRPAGHYAGKLISDCGLRGQHVGGAQVSEKHAGFIVNTGGATATDIRRLTDRIITSVRDQTGVTLVPEIRFIGEWDRGGAPWKS